MTDPGPDEFWISVLGPVGLMRGDVLVFAPRRGRPHTLLAALAACHGSVVDADALVGALWPEDLPENPLAALQSQVFRLRRSLGPVGTGVENVAGGYRLAADACGLDTARFREHLAVAASADPPAALRHVEAALALWRGRPFGDCAEPDLVAPVAAALTRARAEALRRRVELLLDLGRVVEAAAAAPQAVAADEFAEAPVVVAARALAAAGRHADALATCRAFRARLRVELGLDPSPGFRATEESVLRHLAEAPSASPAVHLPGNSFVGRAEEVATLVDLLDRDRVVTIVGPGGVGKTRLALQTAAAVAGRYPDGVFVCELAAVAEGSAVAAAVATALRVDRAADADPAARVVAFLRPLRALLVLDNGEHLARDVAVLVDAVREGSPEVSVLLTSRTALPLGAGQTLLLAPLAGDEDSAAPAAAVTLFLDRLRSMRHGFDPGPEAMAAIHALCAAAGGLPLAVELAAAQCLARSPVVVERELRDWSQVRDPHRAVPRHRSIQDVLAWSADLLGPDARAAFELLAVFRGGFTAEGACEVLCAVEPDGARDVPARLTELVAASLLTVADTEAGSRYAMLEPIRQYAAACCSAGPAAQAAQGHAAWAVGFAQRVEEGLRGADEGRWHLALQAEWANLRVAHRWCLEHDQAGALRLAASYRTTLWHASAELIDWTAATLQRYGDRTENPVLPIAWATAGVGAWWRGDFAGARRLGEEAVLAAPAPDHPVTRFAWEVLGDAAIWSQDHDRALSCLDRAVAAARAAGDAHQEVAAALTRCLCLAYAGDPDAALAELADLRPQVQATENPTCLAFADYVEAESTPGDRPGYALRLLDRAARTAFAGHSEFLAHECLQARVTYQVAAGAAADAVDVLARLIGYWHRVGNWNQQWATLATAAGALAQLGRAEEAAVLRGALSASPHPEHAAAPVGAPDLHRRGVLLGPEDVVRYALDLLHTVGS